MSIVRSVRNRALLMMGLLVGICAVLFVNAMPAAAAPAAVGTFNGTAYAAFVQTPGNLANVGPLFPVGIGCAVASQSGNAVGNLTALGLSSAGTAVDSVAITNSATSGSAIASSEIAGLSLLGGAITATSIRSEAETQADTTTALSTNNSTFTNLVIGGVPIVANPAPNTKVNLPGIGTVTVNEQVGPVNSANASSITTIALDVSITTPVFSLPVGAHVLVAYASTNYTRTVQPASVGAFAYGLSATLPPTTTFGPFAAVGLGCAGGSHTVSTAGVSVPPLSVGAITSSAFGSVGASGSTATGQTSITSVNVLGLLAADAVNARATASFTPALHGYTGYSVTLTNASLLGGVIPLPASPAPNTTITIPGVGTAILNEQSVTTSLISAKIVINAIDITVTTANLLGLPVGSRIIVGHADANVTANV